MFLSGRTGRQGPAWMSALFGRLFCCFCLVEMVSLISPQGKSILMPHETGENLKGEEG